MGDLIQFPRRGAGSCATNCRWKCGFLRIIEFITSEIDNMTDEKIDEIATLSKWVTIPLLVLEIVHLAVHVFK